MNASVLRSRWTVRRIQWLLPLAGAALALWANSRRYLPFLSDDALISLRYAARLLEGRGLTWSSGQPVEGYSNLLWTLLLAALGALGVDLVFATRLLGALSMLGFAVVVVRHYRHDRLFWASCTLGLVAIALTGPFGAWTIGGLEQPLVAFLLAGSQLSLFAAWDGVPRAHLIAGLYLGGLCLTRPDGPLFVGVSAAVFVLFAAVMRKVPWWKVVWISGLPFACFLGQLVFRLAYYGEWVPNTALVKVAFSVPRFKEGLTYIRDAWACTRPLSDASLVALLFGLSWNETRFRTALLLANALAWSGYVAAVGGDIFPAYRHFVPVIALLGLGLIEGLRAAAQRGSKGVWLASVAAASVFCATLWFEQPALSENRRAIEERWEWDGQALGLLLRDAFKGRRATVAVTAGGSIPFWSELEAIDMLGLNDYYLPRHPPKEFGTGWLGHELGEGRYVMRRKPDLIVFYIGGAPVFRAGTELQNDPEFHRLYQPIQVRTTHPKVFQGQIYVRRDSSKVGIAANAKELTAPGYLVTGGNPAEVSAGALVTKVVPEQFPTLDLNEPVDAQYVEVRSRPPGVVQATLDPSTPTRLTFVASVPAEILSVRVVRK